MPSTMVQGLVVDRHQGGVESLSVAQPVDEVEARRQNRTETARAVVVVVAAGERVDHDVGRP